MDRDLKVLILAAGLGKRMKSELVKVLHPLCGRPMLSYVIDLAKSLSEEVVAVVGRQANRVRETYRDEPIKWVEQQEQLGTGHAVSAASGCIEDWKGDVLVLSGDVPLLRLETLRAIAKYHKGEQSGATVLTAFAHNPEGYGRILRRGDEVIRICEEGDASEEVRATKEINTGIYVFKVRALLEALSQIKPANVQKEYYLTDTIGILSERGDVVRAFRLEEFGEAMGINTRGDLAEARKVLQSRINQTLMVSGVTIVDPGTTEIDWEVRIGRDTVINPFSSIKGETVIGEGCDIGPNAVIIDSRIGRGVRVGSFARLVNCHLGATDEE